MPPTATTAFHAPVYQESILTSSIWLPSAHICKESLPVLVVEQLQKTKGGICTHHGYIQSNSFAVKYITEGHLHLGKITMTVVFSCKVCTLTVHQILKGCHIEKITTIGIHALFYDTDHTQMIRMLLPTEYHKTHPLFAACTVNQTVDVEILSVECELGQTYLSVIGKLVDEKPLATSC
jgi:hypothetical protein